MSTSYDGPLSPEEIAAQQAAADLLSPNPDPTASEQVAALAGKVSDGISAVGQAIKAATVDKLAATGDRAISDLEAAGQGFEDTVQNGQDKLAEALPEAVARGVQSTTGPAVGVVVALALIALATYFAVRKGLI